jgi:photosystem II stability/assembly factor-like uncharacterized protein
MGLMGARVLNILTFPNRTFVLYTHTDRGLMVTRDGGMSWRTAPAGETAKFPAQNFKEWQGKGDVLVRVNDQGELLRTTDGGKTATPAMQAWHIPLATAIFLSSRGWIASGPGGCYQSQDALKWTEMTLWQEEETGAADFLHAYWMGRYYGFLQEDAK